MQSDEKQRVEGQWIEVGDHDSEGCEWMWTLVRLSACGSPVKVVRTSFVIVG